MLASRRSERSHPGRFLYPLIPMRLFYLDESGNPEASGPSERYVLAAIGIPIEYWTKCDKAINQLKRSYDMPDAEIHTAWMLRSYKEQEDMAGFNQMSYTERRTAVLARRRDLIEKATQAGDAASLKRLKQLKKNFKNTEAYIHLTLFERKRFIQELACKVKSWKYARLFAEIIDKKDYQPPKPDVLPQGQAFERIVTRIEKYLEHISCDEKEYGLLIHDQCESVSSSHTENMKRYYRVGTFRASIRHIIETPLFVDSNLTGMVQIADLCAYAIRRYYDFNDDSLFNVIKDRADKVGETILGLNHYTSGHPCSCVVCRNRKRR